MTAIRNDNYLATRTYIVSPTNIANISQTQHFAQTIVVNKLQMLALKEQLTSLLAAKQPVAAFRTWLNGFNATNCLPLCDYLFYSKGQQLANFFNWLTNPQVCPHRLLELCEKMLSLLPNLKIDKKNSVRATQFKFEASLINSLKLASYAVRQHIQQQQPAAADIRRLLHDKMLQLEELSVIGKGLGERQAHNSLVDKDQQSLQRALNAQQDLAPQPALAIEILERANLQFASRVVINNDVDNQNQKLMLNAVTENSIPVLIGVIKSFSQASNMPRLLQQLIKIEKNNLLNLIKNYQEHCGQLNAEQIQYFRQFLAIKRGSYLAQLKARLCGTQSEAAFKRLLAHKHKLLAEAPILARSVELPLKLSNYLARGDYQQINQLVSTFGAEDERLLQTMHIEHAGYRANLLFHLCEAQAKTSRHLSDKQQQALKLAIAQVVKHSQSHELVKHYASLQANGKESAFSLILQQLNAVKAFDNKLDAVLDTQHIVLGIVLNPHVSAVDKRFLIAELKHELKLGLDGKYRKLYYKQGNYSAALALTTSQSSMRALRSDLAAIHGQALAVAAAMTVAGMSSGINAILNEARSQFALFGKTKSAKSCLRVLELAPLVQQLQFSPQRESPAVGKTVVTRSLVLKQRSKQIQQLLIHKAIIKTSLSACLFKQLDDLTAIEQYYLLTRCFNGQLLLTALFEFSSAEDFPRLSKLLQDVMVYDLVKNETRQELAQLSVANYRQLLAKVPNANANSCLIYLYKMVGVALLDEDKVAREQKLRLLGAAIERGLSDKSSKWYKLYKYQQKRDFKLSLTTGVASSLLGGASAVGMASLYTGGSLTGGLAIPLIAIANIVPKLGRWLSDYCRYGSTPESQAAKLTLTKLRKLTPDASLAKNTIENHHVLRCIRRGH